MVTIFWKMLQCTTQFFSDIFILKIAHGPVTSLEVFHFQPLNTQLSSKCTQKMVCIVYNLLPMIIYFLLFTLVFLFLSS